MLEINEVFRKLIVVPNDVFFKVTPFDEHRIIVTAMKWHNGHGLHMGYVTSPFRRPHGQGEFNASVKRYIRPVAQLIVDGNYHPDIDDSSV